VASSTVTSDPALFGRQSVLFRAALQLGSSTLPQFVQTVSELSRSSDGQHERIAEDVDGRVTTMTIDYKQVTDELLHR